MADGSLEQEAIDAAHSLTETLQGTADELAGMRRELAAMNTYGHRNRHLIAGVAVSIALDIALTVIVAVIGIQAHHASDVASLAAAQNHASALASCRTSNVSRAAEVQLWTHLVAVTPPAAGTKPAVATAARLRASALLAYVRKTFAPRDCAQIYGQRRLPGACPPADLCEQIRSRHPPVQPLHEFRQVATALQFGQQVIRAERGQAAGAVDREDGDRPPVACHGGVHPAVGVPR